MPEALSAKLIKGKNTAQAQEHTTGDDHQPVPKHTPGAALALQRSAGNHALNHLLGKDLGTMPSTSGLQQRKRAYGNNTMAGGERKEFSKQQGLGVRTKLKVGESGNIYEQEADRIADQMLKATAESKISGAHPQIRRLRGKPSGQMDAPNSVYEALAGPGIPLEPALRQDMERRFDRDFSQVRVRHDAAAKRSARDMNARAYTIGQNIVFGEGQFAPGAREGQRLIAHELTHVEQQKNSHPQSIIQLDRIQGKKDPSSEEASGRKGGFGTISSEDYQKSTNFRDKGKVSIVSSTKIIKTTEVMHTRQTPSGEVKLPYEFALFHERRVEIETPMGDKAVLVIKADKYLPFDILNANPKIPPKKAISLSGDFCKLRWSLVGEFGKGKYKEALYREYGISGIEEMVQGKTLEIFLASRFYREETLRPTHPRDVCSLKEITEKNGPAFLHFNLTDRQQYQHIVDYLDGLLAERLKSEVELRKKLGREKKKEKKRVEEEKRPARAKAIEAVAEADLKEAKGITLPGWLKGILIPLVGLALLLGAVAIVAGIIALGAEIFAGAAFVATFWTAFKIITGVVFVINLVRSFVNRYGEAKLSGVGDFFRKLGVSFLDAFLIGEFIESFTDRSLITGKPLNLSEEDRWRRRTLGVISIIGVAFGLKSWLRKGRGGTTATSPSAPQTEPPAVAPPASRPAAPPEPPQLAAPPITPRATPLTPRDAAINFRARFSKIDQGAATLEGLTEIFRRTMSGKATVTARPGRYLPSHTRGASGELRAIVQAAQRDPTVIRIRAVPQQRGPGAQRTPDLELDFRLPDGRIETRAWEIRTVTGGRVGYQAVGSRQRITADVNAIVNAIRAKIFPSGKPSQLAGGGDQVISLPFGGPNVEANIGAAVIQLNPRLAVGARFLRVLRFQMPGRPEIRYVRAPDGTFEVAP